MASLDGEVLHRYLFTTPGPTEVTNRVRLAMARKSTNPVLDPGFLEFYRGRGV